MVGEADLAASVSFLVGGANAHSLVVGLGLGPMVEQSHVKGLS